MKIQVNQYGGGKNVIRRPKPGREETNCVTVDGHGRVASSPGALHLQRPQNFRDFGSPPPRQCAIYAT